MGYSTPPVILTLPNITSSIISYYAIKVELAVIFAIISPFVGNIASNTLLISNYSSIRFEYVVI